MSRKWSSFAGQNCPDTKFPNTLFFVNFLKLPPVKFANLSCESRQKSY